MALRHIPEYPQSNQEPKIIITTKGDKVLVDEEDYPLLSRHVWYTHGRGKHTPYAFTVMKTERAQVWRCIFMHHLILGTSCIIDHIDNNSFNNQKHNFRSASYQQNGWNRPKGKNTKSGKPTSQYKGVSAYKDKNGNILYRVIIKLTAKGVIPAKFFRKSGFHSEIEAAKCYNNEVIRVRGKWAWVNPV